MKHSLLVFLFLPLAAFGQVAETFPKRGLWLGLSFSPDLIYRTTSSKNDNFESQLDELERSNFGYTTGINILYELDERITLDGGIQYSQKGYCTVDQVFLPPLGSGEPEHGWFEYDFSYLDFPLKLNYRLFKKGNFFVSSGASFHVKLKYKPTQILFYQDGRREEKSPSLFSDPNFKSFNMSLVVGFGGEMKLTKNSILRIESLFRHMITPINDGVVKYYLWSTGLNVGFYRRLR
jgi:hypothetical protein